MELPSDATLEVEAGMATIQHQEKIILVAAPGFTKAAQFSLRDNRLVLTFKKGNRPLQGSIWFTDSTVDEDALADIETRLSNLETNLDLYTHGGASSVHNCYRCTSEKVV